MDMKERSGSRVMMTLSQSNGVWLNGCLQPQHYYVTVRITDPEGDIVAEVALSYEQAARMLLYNGEVDCTLHRYRDKEGKLTEEIVNPPETVRDRMHKRLNDVEGSLLKRLEDAEKDIYEMINGHSKPGKKKLQELKNNIDTIKSHLKSNRDYVAQQTENELAEMQSNMLGQIGLHIQSKLGVEVPEEALKSLLPVSDGPLMIEEEIAPVMDSYEPKERKEIPIEDMTYIETADALHHRLRVIENHCRKNHEKKISLYYPSVTPTSKGRITIRYVNYQTDSTIDLDLAKRYLKFLRSIKNVSEFKHHWHFESK